MVLKIEIVYCVLKKNDVWFRSLQEAINVEGAGHARVLSSGQRQNPYGQVRQFRNCHQMLKLFPHHGSTAYWPPKRAFLENDIK